MAQLSRGNRRGRNLTVRVTEEEFDALAVRRRERLGPRAGGLDWLAGLARASLELESWECKGCGTRRNWPGPDAFVCDCAGRTSWRRLS